MTEASGKSGKNKAAMRVSGTALYTAKVVTEWCIRKLPGGTTVFFDGAQYPWTQDLEASSAAIASELTALFDGRSRVPGFIEVSPEQKALTQGEDWRTYFFHLYGQSVDENCATCPETTRLLKRIPGLETAFFSILAPGKHIPEHRGPFKGVLRYHLGLVVPSRDVTVCGIRVGDEQRSWDVGQSLVFDDSFPHEAWNRTDAIRAVLFVDFERPLPWPLTWLNRLVIRAVGRSDFVRGAVTRARRIARERVVSVESNRAPAPTQTHTAVAPPG